MKKLVALVVLSVLYFMFSPASSDAAGFYYITSEEDLQTTDKAHGREGLAVYLPFYANTSAEVRRIIEVLVSYELSLNGKPVFVYGQPFDHALAKKLLKDEDGSGCGSTFYAGVFLYMTKENKLSPIIMCAGGPKYSEELARKMMEEQWVEVKAGHRQDESR